MDQTVEQKLQDEIETAIHQMMNRTIFVSSEEFERIEGWLSDGEYHYEKFNYRTTPSEIKITLKSAASTQFVYIGQRREE